MKKTLLYLLCAMMGFFLPYNAKAYTVDEIVAAGTLGGQYIWNESGTIFYNSYNKIEQAMNESRNVTFSKVNGKLRVTGFFANFWINNNPSIDLEIINTSSGATYAAFPLSYVTYRNYGARYNSYGYVCVINASGTGEDADMSNVYYLVVPDSYDNAGGVNRGLFSVKKDEQGRFVLDPAAAFSVGPAEYQGGVYYYYNVGNFKASNYRLTTILENSDATFKYAPYTDDRLGSYQSASGKFGVVMDQNPTADGVYTFTIDNFLTLEPPYKTLLNISSNGVYNFVSTPSTVKGCFDLNGNAIIDKYEMGMYFLTSWQNESYPTPAVNVYGSSFTDSEGNYDGTDITGTATYKLNHGSLRWTDYNTTGTTVSVNFSFPEAKVSNVYFDIKEDVLAFKDIRFSTDFKFKPNCSVNNNHFGYGKAIKNDNADYIYLSGSISPDDNISFITSHELFIAPNNSTTPTTNPSEFNGDNGHVNGVLIDDPAYYTDYTPDQTNKVGEFANTGLTSEEKAQQLNEGNNYNLLIPASAVSGVSANNYSLYLRTNYTDGSSTFNALTPLGNTTTGVENIEYKPETEAEIAHNGSQITISGSEGNAIIATQDGRVVYQGGDAAVDVAPGMYIVRAGSTVKKIIVK